MTARSALQLQFDPLGVMKNQTSREATPGNSDRARVSMGTQPDDDAHRSGNDIAPDIGNGSRGGGSGNNNRLPSLAQLTPSVGQLEKLAGMPANDDLRNVETDDETRLNAWRWKHATFFNRVADALRRHWRGGEVFGAADPTGHVYGVEDRVTVLSVTLDRQGNLVDVAIAEASGAEPLDEEAVRAFKAAGPFANPPVALFKGGDRFTFTFGFDVNVSAGRGHGMDFNWRPY
jgi:TonB family protein